MKNSDPKTGISQPVCKIKMLKLYA